MAVGTVQRIVVDTNVYLRLYCSDIRPLLGIECLGHQFVITKDLHDEFDRNHQLVTSYAWMLDPVIVAERRGAIVPLSKAQRAKIEISAQLLAQQSTPLLEAHCLAQNISLRRLSRADLNLLATVDVLDGVVATDEWPMTLVAKQLSIACVSSLDLVSMLERAEKISSAQRRELVLDWIRMEEKLPRDWKQIYVRLFKQQPPSPN